MISYEVIPLERIGPVHLGMSRDTVQSVLGECRSFLKTPASVHPTDAWYNGNFQVYYGGSQAVVECIEVSNNLEFLVSYMAIPVFDTPALGLVERIEQISRADQLDPEFGCSYIFPALELSLWRPTIEDYVFSTIGIGQLGYFSSAT